MIHILAEIVTKPGQRDVVLNEFQKIVPDVRNEPGCLEYGPALEIESGLPVQPPIQNDVIYVIEKWESLQALNEHVKAKPLQDFLRRAGSSIERIVPRVLQPA